MTETSARRRPVQLASGAKSNIVLEPRQHADLGPELYKTFAQTLKVFALVALLAAALALVSAGALPLLGLGLAMNHAPNKRVMMVARVSTQAQGQKETTTLPEQLASMRCVCRNFGWDPIPHLEVSIEASGAKSDAEHIKLIDEAIAHGEVDILMFFSWDRFVRSRSLGDDLLKRWGKQVMVVIGGQIIDPDNPDHLFSAQVQMSASEHRRNKLVYAAGALGRLAEREGRWIRKAIPVGYALDPLFGVLVRIDSWAEQVATLFDVVAQHGPKVALKEAVAMEVIEEDARLRAEAGVKVPASPWTHLRQIILNPIYIAMLDVSGRLTPIDGIELTKRDEAGKERNHTIQVRIVPDDVAAAAAEQYGVKRNLREEAMLAPVADRVGFLAVVQRLFDLGEIPCLDCGKPLRLVDPVYRPDHRIWVPQVRCTGECPDVSLFDRWELDGLHFPRGCWQCGAVHQRDFHVQAKRPMVWKTTCRICGWELTTRDHPFGKDAPRPLPPGWTQSLDDWGFTGTGGETSDASADSADDGEKKRCSEPTLFDRRWRRPRRPRSTKKHQKGRCRRKSD